MEPLEKYRIEIFYSTEDKCFIANVPGVKYCSAHGDTPEQALREVKVALRGVLATLTERGFPAPEPSRAGSRTRSKAMAGATRR